MAMKDSNSKQLNTTLERPTAMGSTKRQSILPTKDLFRCAQTWKERWGRLSQSSRWKDLVVADFGTIVVDEESTEDVEDVGIDNED